jgi:hypothetical protein
MGRLIITDMAKPRLEIIEQRTRRRITPEETEAGLGAQRVAFIPPGGSSMSAFALRQELFRRLRSTAGRPGLESADMKPKIPMRRSSWTKLEQIARQVETADFHRHRHNWPRLFSTPRSSNSILPPTRPGDGSNRERNDHHDALS